MVVRRIVQRRLFRFLFLISLVCSSVALPRIAVAESPSPSSLIQYEAQLVYYTNLKRQEYGLPPLRWNRELSLAARDFSHDAVVNQPSGFCGHTDSTGRMPGERFRDHGYVTMAAWGENVICGLVTPKSAIIGWTNSEQHRNHLLDPNFREVGIGYYRDDTSGLGFVTQDLSADPGYAPVIVNHEALHTTSAEVELYIYSPMAQSGFHGVGPAVDMLVSNRPDFAGAVWEAYSAEKMWQLESGEGWRTVYVKLRDDMGRTTTTWDTIYLGSEPASDELSLAQASSIESSMVFAEAAPAGTSHVQYRLNWLADNRDESFTVQAGAVEEIAAADAHGGTLVRLFQGSPGKVELYTHRFVKDLPLQALIQLKVNDIQPAGEAVRMSINAGGVDYGPLTIDATAFAAADRYQEFALPFVFRENREHPFLFITVESTGLVDVDFDAVTFFTEPTPLSSPLQWRIPGGIYRGQSIWARFVDAQGVGEGPVELSPQAVSLEAVPAPRLTVSGDDETLHFDVQGGEVTPAAITLDVNCVDCGGVDLTAECDVEWLALTFDGQGLTVSVDPTTLPPDDYAGTVEILAYDSTTLSPISVTVDITVLDAPAPSEDVEFAGDPTSEYTASDEVVAEETAPEEAAPEETAVAVDNQDEGSPNEEAPAQGQLDPEVVDPGQTPYSVYLPYTINR